MITLGRHSYTGAVKELYDPLVTVGSFCSIANGTTFLGHCEHPPAYIPQVVSTYNFAERWQTDCYPSCTGHSIKIGNDVWIGEDALILDGVTIGDGAIIGARAVVATKEIPPYAVVVGNPGRVVKYRFTPEEIEALLRIQWWNWPDEKIREALPYMKDINEFLEVYGR